MKFVTVTLAPGLGNRHFMVLFKGQAYNIKKHAKGMQ